MIFKKNIALILFLIISYKSFSQAPINFQTMSHVHEEWKGLRHCDTLYYANKIQPEVIDATIKQLRSKKVYPVSDLYMGANKAPLIVTVAEQTYLIAELKKLKSFEWPSGMFPNSKLINIDSTKSVFLITNKLPKSQSDECSIIYTFSKPIYFRNGSIALYLDQEQYSNISTQLTYNFYYKENKEWVEYADCYINMGKEDPGDN
ncbi:hypothetical protein [Mucilaginibacter sp.]